MRSSSITQIAGEEIVTSIEASSEVESLHQPAYQKDGSEILLMEKLSKEGNETEKVIDHVLLNQAMKHLEERERKIIQYRYFDGKTQQEIADYFIFPRCRFQEWEKKILKKLKRQMVGKYLKNMLK